MKFFPQAVLKILKEPRVGKQSAVNGAFWPHALRFT